MDHIGVDTNKEVGGDPANGLHLVKCAAKPTPRCRDDGAAWRAPTSAAVRAFESAISASPGVWVYQMTEKGLDDKLN